MTNEEKKEIAAHFVESFNLEGLHNRDAVKYLNLKLCYISWIKNEKCHDSISKAAWERFKEWHISREKISDFNIPEGETLLEFTGPEPVAYFIRSETDERSPENLQPSNEIATQVKQKRKYTRHEPAEGKSVKIILQKKEIEEINKRIDLLIEDNNRQACTIKELQTNNLLLQNENYKLCKLGDLISELSSKVFVMEDETIAIMRKEIKDLQEGIGHLVTIPKAENKPGLIVFQRNIYK